jgi:hypothetical protein
MRSNVKKLGLALTCAVLIAVFFSMFGTTPAAAAYGDTYVDDDAGYADGDGDEYFATIQAAIDETNVNGTVHIAAGTYDQNNSISITKSLTLSGDPAGSQPKITFTDGDYDGFVVEADNVTLENLWLHREGHSEYRSIIGVPKGGGWPDYTIDTRGLTVRNCLVEGGRYGMYASVEDMTVEGCTFKEPYSDGIVTAGITGTTTITNNQFIGTGDTKQAIYMTTGPGKPYDGGTLNIAHNTHTGGGHFFLVDYWGWDESNSLDLEISHNSIDQIGDRKGVVFYAAYSEDPKGFPKFNSIAIQDNMFTNCGPAIYVDYEDWGGAPAADDRSVPADGQIAVHNNLTYNVTSGTDDTLFLRKTAGFLFDNAKRAHF